MEVYKSNIQTIVQTQYEDPLLMHISKRIGTHLKTIRGQRVLDIGCGVGRTSLLAASFGFNVIGVDTEPKAIRLARMNAKNFYLDTKCTFIIGDILKQRKLLKKKFDIVICSEVIEHVEKPQTIINFAFRLLKKDGSFILTTPHDPNLWSVLDEYAGHVKRYRIEEIKQLLRKFRITKLYTIGFPLMRVIIIVYNYLIKIMNIPHSASWRKNKLKNQLYALLVGLLLKCDDIFNFLNRGTTIVVIAKK